MKLLNSEKLTAKNCVNILYIILVKLADEFFKFEKFVYDLTKKFCKMSSSRIVKVLMNTSRKVQENKRKSVCSKTKSRRN